MAPNICSRVGKRIRELRKLKGWRQIDLAQHSGVHEVHISHLERGSREVGLKTLFALSSALDVKLEVLFKGLD